MSTKEPICYICSNTRKLVKLTSSGVPVCNDCIEEHFNPVEKKDTAAKKEKAAEPSFSTGTKGFIVPDFDLDKTIPWPK
jgi:ribosome-binding protein aMBF1 (putative translation factor)